MRRVWFPICAEPHSSNQASFFKPSDAERGGHYFVKLSPGKICDSCYDIVRREQEGTTAMSHTYESLGKDVAWGACNGDLAEREKITATRILISEPEFCKAILSESSTAEGLISQPRSRSEHAQNEITKSFSFSPLFEKRNRERKKESNLCRALIIREGPERNQTR